MNEDRSKWKRLGEVNKLMGKIGMAGIVLVSVLLPISGYAGPREGFSSLKGLLAQSPVNNGELLKEKGRAALEKKNYQEATRILTEALELNPKNRKVRYHLAQALAELKRYEEAINHLNIVKAEEPENPYVRRALGWIYAANGQFNESVSEYRKILKKAPKDLSIALVIARNLTWAGRYKEAIEEYKRLLSATPEGQKLLREFGPFSQISQTSLVPVAWMAGPEALSRRLILLAQKPEEITPLLLFKELGRAQLWGKNYQDAARTLTKALELDPKDRLVRYYLAQALAGLKRYKEAINHLNIVKAEEPENRDVRTALGWILSANGQFLEAAEEYRVLLRFKPGDRDISLSLARNLSYARRFQEALIYLEEILKANPDDLEAKLERARFNSWSGRYKQAEADFKEVLAVRPQDPEARFGLAAVYLHTRRKRQALQQLDQTLKIAPGHSGALQLRKDTLETLRPYLDLPVLYWVDVDRNRRWTSRVTGSLFIEPQSRLELGFYRTDAHSPGDADFPAGFRTSLTQVSAAVDTQITAKVRLKGGLALASLERQEKHVQRLLPRIGAVVSPLPDLEVAVGFEKRVLDYTAVLIENDIRTNTVASSLNYRPFSSVFLSVRYDYADYSDGNVRRRVGATIKKSLLKLNPRLTLGYGFDFMSFARDLDNGYFDPSGYVAHKALLDFSGSVFQKKLTFYLSAFMGWGRVQGQENIPPRFEPIWGTNVLIRAKITDRFSAAAGFNYFRSASVAERTAVAQRTADYWESTTSFRFRYEF